jgi:hypothetical protein
MIKNTTQYVFLIVAICNKKKISNTNMIPQDVRKDHHGVDVATFHKFMCIVLWVLLLGCMVS